LVNGTCEERRLGTYLKQLANLLATLCKQGIDVACNGGDRRDDGMGLPSSKNILKFSIVNNVHWSVALCDPLDNTSTGCHD